MKIFGATVISTLALFVIQAVGTPQWRTGKDGSMFLLENEYKYNWLQASNECTRRGLQLLTIDGPQKNAEVIDLVNSVYGQTFFMWIGATDEYQIGASLPFYWSSNGKVMEFTNWRAGEPNNVNDVEHCATIWKGDNLEWNDARCERPFGYICEIKKSC